MRRHAILLLGQGLLMELVKGLKAEGPLRHFEVQENPIPEDATVVRSFFDPERGLECIVLESEEFDPVPDGERIPDLPAVQLSVRYADEVPA